MDGVSGGVNGHIRGQQAVVAEGDLAHIQNSAVVVAEEVFAHLDMVAVVAVEGRVDEGGLLGLQQLLNHPGDALKVGAVHGVQLLGQNSGPLLLFVHGFIGDVGHLGIAAFPVCHGCSSLVRFLTH